MARVKVYECPRCKFSFTSALIKKSGGRCPGCRTLLKHDIVQRDEGGVEHVWIIDSDDLSEIAQPEDSEDLFERVSERGESPIVYKFTGDHPKENQIKYRVVYENRFGETHLRCPECNGYLHTTSIISGDPQRVYCRANLNKNGRSWVCKTRTEFVFRRHIQGNLT